MTRVLSGSRPIVTISPTEHSFNTRSSNCRTSFGIVPSKELSSPMVPKTRPSTANHLHDHDGDVVRTAVAVGGGEQHHRCGRASDWQWMDASLEPLETTTLW